MLMPENNPFVLNRAADFSDSQIIDYWVDYSEGGLLTLLEPRSVDSIYLLGGKGSGKTHLMRYCSFPVQKIRYEYDLLEGLKEEGFVGVFTRANTFDTGRFQGKGQEAHKWGDLFNYYFEVRLCEQLLSTLVELLQCTPELTSGLDKVAEKAAALFDSGTGIQFNSIESFYEGLVSLRKIIDMAVNNCAFTKSLDLEILVTPGNLLFGLPSLIVDHVKEFKNIQILYLIDEVENYSNEKQQFINTLVRHRRGPCSFRIGARLYGIRTFKNYGSDEENKDGSEFKAVYLDRAMREHDGTNGYEKFARKLCAKRLFEAGVLQDITDENLLDEALDRFFETPIQDNFYRTISLEIVRSSQNKERKYFKKLREQLRTSRRELSGLGIVSDEDASEILECLSCPPFPILEKANIFIFYKEWNGGNNLKDAAKDIEKSCREYLSKDGGGERHRRVLGHFSRDLLAQLYRDYKLKTTSMYAGFSSFVRMSAGVPRNLLIILHNMYKWARFNGERPFTNQPISIETQREAILESSIFYYEEDARPGVDVPNVKEAVTRLAEYLREVRFASKPVEASPLAFSLDERQLSQEAKQRLKQAENWSYIFSITRGRPHANSQRVDSKYQLNPMLSPKWDLPIGRRGDVRLSENVANAIFGDVQASEYKTFRDEYVEGLNPPFVRKTGKETSQKDNRTMQLKFDD